MILSLGVFAVAADVEVRATWLRNDNGLVRVLLFNSSKGFPSKYKSAEKAAAGIIVSRRSGVVFKDVAPGKYAVSVIHDENSNGKLDANLLGIPKEGVGTSNNPATKFGPPSFKQAEFVVSTMTVTLDIRVSYLK